MGFDGPSTITLMVFGPYNPIIWVLRPLGYGSPKGASDSAQFCRCAQNQARQPMNQNHPHLMHLKVPNHLHRESEIPEDYSCLGKNPKSPNLKP